jgi:hypothetical protein
MSHHGDNPEQRKAMSNMMAKIFGEYPDGKLNKNDEGAIAMAVANENGRVILRFPKPVEWIGLCPQEAVDLAESLIEHARRSTTEPLTVSLGRKP